MFQTHGAKEMEVQPQMSARGAKSAKNASPDKVLKGAGLIKRAHGTEFLR